MKGPTWDLVYLDKMSWIEIPGDTSGVYNFSDLAVNEAFLKVTSVERIKLYSLSDECYKCPFTYVRSVTNSTLDKISTKYGVSWRAYRDTNSSAEIDISSLDSLICEIRPRHFGQFGVYHLDVKNESCEVTTVSEPVNIYKPLLIICAALLILSFIWTLLGLIYAKCKKQDDWMGDDASIPDKKKKVRIKALDTFRGFCIILMIFVNDGAGQYTFLEHATWNGLNMADTLFPWFLWIMGVCIPISVKSQLKKKVPRIQIFLGIIRRSVLLFLIGVALNTVSAGPSLEHIRIFGVLQRFGVVYLVVASLLTFFMINIKFGKEEFLHSLKDVLNLIFVWILMAFVVALHVYLMFFFPIPGCPTGYVGPGGVQYNGKYEKCTGGFAGYIDKIILFGENHLYQKHGVREVYKAGPFDPEGPFGCLISIFHAFLGVQAGSIIVNYTDWKARVKRWLFWGVICGIAALILCQGRQEGGWIPINKSIWSLSYVLSTSGLAFILLSLIYILVDVNGLWSGSPFFYAGMNSILLYAGHSVGYKIFPWHWSYGLMNTHFFLTIEAIWGAFLWGLVAYWLHKQEFYLAL